MRKHFGFNSDKGGALLIVLCIMLLLTVGSLVAVDTAQRDIDLSFNQLHYDQAFYVAEAGVREGVYQLNLNNAYNTSLVDVPFDQGSYWLAVIHSNVDEPVDDTVILRATARVNEACANIIASVVPELVFPFNFAVFGDEFVTVNNDASTGSYDSEVDPFPATYTGTDGDVASNGTVTLDNSASVDGDASSALDPGLDICAVCPVSGDLNEGVDPITLDLVDSLPTVYFDPPSDGMTGAYTLSPDDLYGSLTLTNNNSVTLAPGNYFLNDIIMGDGSTLFVSGEVTIYMKGDLILSQNTSVNPTSTPSDLVIISEGTIETLGNDIDIRAAFYAPDADVTLENSCTFYGSIIANSVTLDQNATVFYDQALAQVPVRTTGRMYMLTWREQ